MLRLLSGSVVIKRVPISREAFLSQKKVVYIPRVGVVAFLSLKRQYGEDSRVFSIQRTGKMAGLFKSDARRWRGPGTPLVCVKLFFCPWYGCFCVGLFVRVNYSVFSAGYWWSKEQVSLFTMVFSLLVNREVVWWKSFGRLLHRS